MRRTVDHQRLTTSAECRPDHVSVESGYEFQRDALRAYGLALTVIGAAAERLASHGGHHVQRSLVALRLALWQHVEVRDLGRVKSMAAAFGHAATHAPHPMHAAASNAVSAASLGTRMAAASGPLPVGALM